MAEKAMHRKKRREVRGWKAEMICTIRGECRSDELCGTQDFPRWYEVVHEKQLFRLGIGLPA